MSNDPDTKLLTNNQQRHRTILTEHNSKYKLIRSWELTWTVTFMSSRHLRAQIDSIRNVNDCNGGYCTPAECSVMSTTKVRSIPFTTNFFSTRQRLNPSALVHFNIWTSNFNEIIPRQPRCQVHVISKWLTLQRITAAYAQPLPCQRLHRWIACDWATLFCMSFIFAIYYCLSQSIIASRFEFWVTNPVQSHR